MCLKEGGLIDLRIFEVEIGPWYNLFWGPEMKQSNTVKLINKERFDKEQIGIKELIMDYQPFYTINLLLDKELLPI